MAMAYGWSTFATPDPRYGSQPCWCARRWRGRREPRRHAGDAAITVGYDYFNEILNITALAAHPRLPVVFAGKSDGCVAVYDAITGKEKAILYSHARMCSSRPSPAARKTS